MILKLLMNFSTMNRNYQLISLLKLMRKQINYWERYIYVYSPFRVFSTYNFILSLNFPKLKMILTNQFWECTWGSRVSLFRKMIPLFPEIRMSIYDYSILFCFEARNCITFLMMNLRMLLSLINSRNYAVNEFLWCFININKSISYLPYLWYLLG